MAGTYRRLRVIGKGSFGCCWLAEDERQERCVMKQIDISTMPAGQREEAANEVRVLSKLRHPFIIGYKESFVEEGVLCIITEYAGRGDLYQLIHDHKSCGRCFEESLVMRWFTQIALALKHVHDRKILHRDLKTQNIFVVGSGDGTAKIGDFGISRVLQHTSDCAMTAIGTPYYLSPEICQEKPYNQKSDVWSLGCVLYELATLQHAFDADSMRGLVMKILRGVPPQVPLIFSAEVRELVPDMLVKDPCARPSINQVLQRPVVRHVIHQLLQEIEQQPASVVGQPKTPEDAAMTKLPQAASWAPGPAAAAKLPRGSPEAGQAPTAPSGPQCRELERAAPASGLSEAAPPTVPDHTVGDHPRRERPLEPSSASPQHQHQLGHGQLQEGPPAGAAALPPPGAGGAAEPAPARAGQDRRGGGGAGRRDEAGAAAPERGAAAPAPPADPQEQWALLSITLTECLAGDAGRAAASSGSSAGTKATRAATEPGSAGAGSPSLSFRGPDGVPVELHVGEKDSLCYRAEALRVYIERELGINDFLYAYRHLNENVFSDDMVDRCKPLEAVISSKAIGFMPLIHQLIVCEDECFGQ
ncbi:unnamed protein product [Prorocentrum cordatum]|uniref:non-specific serine/threonine protein kinase n=1 Tax=Prorocentrum cordatum TaxID=2364126 RepID=A0ABN9W0I3_9DINO|nr:unnamed protein product [Polarella glacialis]